MSKNQKGKKHRTVNRRPRPVGAPAVRTRAAAPVPAHAEAAVHTEAVVHAQPDGGLGRSVERTWRGLMEAGAVGTDLAELSAAVGYQPQTVRKHLKGLLESGMAEEAEGLWRATESRAVLVG